MDKQRVTNELSIQLMNKARFLIGEATATLIKSLDLCEDNFLGYYLKRQLAIKNTSERAKVKLFDGKSRDTLYKNKNNIGADYIKNIKTKNCKRIVIVLESPHIDEFDTIRYPNIAPAPALGATGTYLQKYFLSLMREYLEVGDYEIILMNAIQYQCSLGRNPEMYRDRVFLNLWYGSDGEMNFKKRLKEYEPDIIVNCCTVGSHKIDPVAPPGSISKINETYIYSISQDKTYSKNSLKSSNKLQDIVQESIDEYKSNNSQVELYKSAGHPSSWYIKRFRKIEKI